MDILRFAVCDDEDQQLKQMAALLEAFFQSRPNLTGQVNTFRTGSTLLSQAEKHGGFDLYLLDILMPGLNGIETGRRLRAKGDGGEIIYLTTSNDFAADSYDVHAFFYLLKPVTQDRLFEVLDNAVEKLNRRRRSAIVVHTSDGPPPSFARSNPLCRACRPLHALFLHRRHGGFPNHPGFVPGDRSALAG